MNDKSLTRRQKEFLALSAQGNTAKQIAYKFTLSIATVNATMRAAKARMGTNTISQTIILAVAREELGVTHDGYCYVPKENL